MYSSVSSLRSYQYLNQSNPSLHQSHHSALINLLTNLIHLFTSLINQPVDQSETEATRHRLYRQQAWKRNQYLSQTALTLLLSTFWTFFKHTHTVLHPSISFWCEIKVNKYNGKWKQHSFCTFSRSGPWVCNELPDYVKHCAALSSFQGNLKTRLFSHFSQLLKFCVTLVPSSVTMTCSFSSSPISPPPSGTLCVCVCVCMRVCFKYCIANAVVFLTVTSLDP